VYKDPLGVVLIIAPWNYPLQLLLIPLAAAIAGGNCAVLKPSEHAKHTSALIASMIKEIYAEEYIKVVEGDGAEVIPAMMDAFRFDHVFYTGSIPVGRSIYMKAAEKLVPVTLELGGKSPAIVTADADIRVSARRIVLGKFLNAGQTCVAPDYVLVHESAKKLLIHEMINAIEKFYGKDILQSDDYGRIIHRGRFNALKKYLNEGRIAYGGEVKEDELYIAPTILTDVSMNDSVMKEEIFGPVLPVMEFKSLDEARSIIGQNPDPLALYLFTKDVQVKKEWMEELSFGGGCVNNTAWHLANEALPFGGVRNSGMGAYHGRRSFDTFTREKSVLDSPTWLDPDLKYPPFKNKKKLLRFFIK
jgi:aldehyde dehydrogenase (NAD+)